MTGKDGVTHPTEDDLILRYYGEPGGPADLEAHLAGCPDCQDAAAALKRSLDAVVAEPVPERADDYGAQVWARVGPRLPAAGRRRPVRWLVPAGLAAAILAAFFLGRHTAPEPPPSAEVVRERILLVAVGDHLERAQMVLVELANAPLNGEIDISSERQRAEELVVANRLYRQTALAAGETAMAGFLDDLERVLVEVARSPETLASPELEELRQRMEAQGVLFKVRVIGSQVRAREKAARPLRAGKFS